MASLFSRQQSQLPARPAGNNGGRFGGQQPPASDLLFNHFGKQNNAALHDHSMLLFAEHKQQTTLGNGLSDGFGNKDWQVGQR